MSREEKIFIAYGIGGWFISIHFGVIILNNIVSQIASFFILNGTRVVNNALIKNSILSLFVYSKPGIIMFLAGLALLFFKNHKLKNYNLKSTEQAMDSSQNKVSLIESVTFLSVAILIILMAVNSIVVISIYQYDSLSALLRYNPDDPFFKHSLAFLGPQYLMSFCEVLLGIFLFKKFSRETLKSEKEIEAI